MCVAKSIPVVATGVLRLYPSGVKTHSSVARKAAVQIIESGHQAG